ncbi:MAG: MBL fold metallo-hydrolase [Candidatus Thermoplasmatota archaeon]
MNIKIVYDNEAKAPLRSDWGFSALIEGEETILFDTGEDGDILKSNFEKMDIDASSIDKVALSHEHHDHIGGLFSIIEPSMKIFVPDAFSERFKTKVKKRATLIEVVEKKEISNEIISFTETGAEVIEQSILCRTDDGNVLVTGCAHPGLTPIIEKAADHGEIKGVVGGFHGFDDFTALEDIPLLVPCHCTEYKDKIKSMYSDKVIDCFAGLEIEV